MVEGCWIGSSFEVSIKLGMIRSSFGDIIDLGMIGIGFGGGIDLGMIGSGFGGGIDFEIIRIIVGICLGAADTGDIEHGSSGWGEPEFRVLLLGSAVQVGLPSLRRLVHSWGHGFCGGRRELQIGREVGEWRVTGSTWWLSGRYWKLGSVWYKV